MRQYQIVAKPGLAAGLASVLGQNAELFAAHGRHGAELLQDIEICEQFVFTHRWDSVDQHWAATTKLSDDLRGALGAELRGMPGRRYLQAPVNQ